MPRKAGEGMKVRKYPPDYPDHMRHRCRACGVIELYFPAGHRTRCPKCDALYEPHQRERDFAEGFALGRWGAKSFMVPEDGSDD